MKRFICLILGVVLLLSACAVPVEEQDYDYGVYALTFRVKRLSGDAGDWDFVYTSNGEVIESGYRITQSSGVFSFCTVRAEVMERGGGNTYTGMISAALCDGGSGKTEIAVTDTAGNTATYEITCTVEQVGRH